jgi:two-component system OmpR family sensor kinase
MPDLSPLPVGESGPDRLVTILDALQALPVDDSDSVLDAACQCLATAFGAAKVDAFLLNPASATLVARGTSDTPLGHRQHALGLHRLPLANGGRTVYVFQTGTSWRDGHVDRDTDELIGVREALGVRSTIAVPLNGGEARRGVLQITDTRSEFFTAEDLHHLEIVTNWVSLLAERAEQTRISTAEARITALTHDLRTPLSSVELALSLLATGMTGPLQPAAAELVTMAGRNVRRLALLVDDFLAVQQLEAGTLGIQSAPLDLREIVIDAAETVRPLLEEREQRLVLDLPESLPLVGDARRLGQVVTNLLANAHRHTPQGTRITVTVALDPTELALVVADDGPGIPTSELERIFAPHHRLGASGGSGLGLALAYSIINQHGGRIWAEHAPGGGTAFRVVLPRAGNAAEEAPN